MARQNGILDGKNVVVTGGTGSLGKVLVRRLLSGEMGKPKVITVFSRDEAKQNDMRLSYQHKTAATDEVIYHNYEQLLRFQIGDVRDYHSVCAVLRNCDVVFNAAALKQVPTCEYFPFEAVLTNIEGPENIVRAIRENKLGVQIVVGVSTDKACKPVNVMGMTKAIQERVFIHGNLDCPDTRFVCVRYGNVLASRGSVIPLFHDQIKHGGPVTITTAGMTRFLISLEQAVNVIFAALEKANRGETFVPKMESAKVIDIASALIGKRAIKTTLTGIRPGEKIHEILVSEEEAYRTVEDDKFFKIQSILPEIKHGKRTAKTLDHEYSSADALISKAEVVKLLAREKLMVSDGFPTEDELLR